MHTLASSLAVLALLSGPTGTRADPPAVSTAPPPAAAPEVVIDGSALPRAITDLPGIERRIFQDGRVYISGQPSEEALARLKERGVTLVVNFRTLQEVADRTEVPFDEPAAVAALGMEYVSVPIGGTDQPYRTEVLERVHGALARHQGPVLLHCTVGWRASYVWTAYTVKYLGLDLDSALARGRAIALTEDPLSLLLGRRLKLVDADTASPSLPSAKP